MADQIQEVKDKTDIVSVVGEHVKLTKAGRNYKGLCPFHSEKTSSFMVNPELQIYKCFGCGEGGDVLSFLQLREGMEFGEALGFLAERAGVKLERGDFQSGEKGKLYELNSWAARVFSWILGKQASGREAREYLAKKRGFDTATIETFGLGYSPERDVLGKYLVEKKGYVERDLVASGIFYKTGRGLVNRFSGRITFPLHDHRGNVVGFSGRVLPRLEGGALAKYINTPETEVYVKRRLLYPLHLTKEDIRGKGYAIIVEGEMDAISLWRAGYRNVVAIKGTALSEEQVRVLSRYCKRVVLALDADLAGNEAARRGVRVAMEQGVGVRVARMQGGKDPDEIVKGDPKGFGKMIDEAVEVWDFIFGLVFAKHDVKSGEGKANISREVVGYLMEIDDKIVQAHYAKKVAEMMDVEEEVVFEQLKKVGERAPISKREEIEVEEPRRSRREILEEALLAAAFLSDPKLLLKKKKESLFRSEFSKRLIDSLGKYFGEGSGKFVLKEFFEYLEPEVRERFSLLIMRDGVGEEGLAGECEELTAELWEHDLREKMRELSGKIKKLEKTGKKRKLLKVERELTRVMGELSALENRA